MNDRGSTPEQRATAIADIRAAVTEEVAKTGVPAKVEVLAGSPVYYVQSLTDSYRLEGSTGMSPLLHPEYRQIFVVSGTRVEVGREVDRAFYNLRGFGGHEWTADGHLVVFWDEQYRPPQIPTHFGDFPMTLRTVTSAEADRRRGQRE